MNSKKTVLILILSLLALIILLASCNNGKNKDNNKVNQIKLYFIDSVNSELVEEKREVDLEKKDDLIKYAIEELQKMPNTVGLRPSIPEGLTVYTAVLKDDKIEIDISSYYNNMSPQEQVLLRASLIKSLSEFDFVNSVEFFIDGDSFRL